MNKARSNRSSRSNYSYVKYVEFFNPSQSPTLDNLTEEKTGKLTETTANKRSQRKPRNIRGPQQGSIKAINRLCQIRLEAIKKGYSIPAKIGAIQEAETTFKTVQRYMPELLDNWKDRNYRPEKLE